MKTQEAFGYGLAAGLIAGFVLLDPGGIRRALRKRRRRRLELREAQLREQLLDEAADQLLAATPAAIA